MFSAKTLYILSHRCYCINLTFFAKVFRALMVILFSSDIHYKCEIGKNVKFPHYGIGVVIHPDTKLGNNCIINKGVTIGGRSGKAEVPKIGNNVLIGVNAIVAGDIIVGNNAQIGAGAVVVKDVPENAVVCGNPARVVKFVDHNSGDK